jgi:hypothetical protein
MLSFSFFTLKNYGVVKNLFHFQIYSGRWKFGQEFLVHFLKIQDRIETKFLYFSKKNIV